MNKQNFKLGQVVATQGVINTISQNETQEALARHSIGDWGCVNPYDREVNNDALVNGGRLLSVYQTSEGIDFWIITEWDRSVTTILLPSEY